MAAQRSGREDDVFGPEGREYGRRAGRWVGVVAVVAAVAGCAGSQASTEPTRGVVAGIVTQSATGDAGYGFARVADAGEFTAIPGEGWWTVTATADDVVDERSLAHPDTVLVAGWDDSVVEAYQRDLRTGVVAIVPPGTFGQVPVDPGWEAAWLVLDAHTLEVLDVLGEVGEVPDGVPEGFTVMPEAEAAGFTELGRDADLTDMAVYTDGSIVGVSALDDAGNGFVVRFASAGASSWFIPQGEPLEVGLAGYTTTGTTTGPLPGLSISALSDTGECGFVISGRGPADSGEPDGLKSYLIEDLPAALAALCDR